MGGVGVGVHVLDGRGGGGSICARWEGWGWEDMC